MPSAARPTASARSRPGSGTGSIPSGSSAGCLRHCRPASTAPRPAPRARRPPTRAHALRCRAPGTSACRTTPSMMPSPWATAASGTSWTAEHAAAIRAVVGLRAGLAPILGGCLRCAPWPLTISGSAAPRASHGRHPLQLAQKAPGQAFLPTLRETALAPFGARPHLGKLFALTPAQLAGVYPRWRGVRHARPAVGPAGRFSNAFFLSGTCSRHFET